MRLEKPVCAPPRLTEVSPLLLLFCFCFLFVCFYHYLLIFTVVCLFTLCFFLSSFAFVFNLLLLFSPFCFCLFVYFYHSLSILTVVYLFWSLYIYFDRYIIFTVVCSIRNGPVREQQYAATRSQGTGSVRKHGHRNAASSVWSKIRKHRHPERACSTWQTLWKLSQKDWWVRCFWRTEVWKYRFGSKCWSWWHEVRNYGFRVELSLRGLGTHIMLVILCLVAWNL